MIADVRAALDLAEQQLVALQLDDIDTFLAGAEAHERACAAVAATRADGLAHEDALLIERLIATNSMVSSEIDRVRSGIAARLASMRRGHTATGAYLASLPRGFAGLHEA